MTILGHKSNSGIQSHSCGEFYPIRSHAIGRPDGLELVASYSGCELRTIRPDIHRDQLAILLRVKRIADAAWKCRTEGSGCSFYAGHDGKTPETGYCVGLEGYETQVAIEDYDASDVYADCKVTDYEPIFKDIFDKIQKIDLSNDRICVGCWVYRGVRYLDISAIIEDRSEALELAASNNQLAIYGLANKEEILLRVENGR